MFVSIYYKPSLFSAHTMILIVRIFMNKNKLCLNHTASMETNQSFFNIDLLFSLTPRKYSLCGNSSIQTPSTGLRHASSNQCHIWLRHRSRKTVNLRTLFHWCSNGSKCVTDRSNDVSRFFDTHPRRTQLRGSRRDQKIKRREVELGSQVSPLRSRGGRWSWALKLAHWGQEEGGGAGLSS